MAQLEKRSISLSGHSTSVALEPEFWAAMEEMARGQGLPVAGLIARLDAGRGARPLASTCRLAVLAHLRAVLRGQEGS